MNIKLNEEDDNLDDQKILLNVEKTSNQRVDYSSHMNMQMQDQTTLKRQETAEPHKSNFVENFINNPREAIANEIMEKAKTELSKNWYDRFKCNFEFLQVYFNVTTDEIKDRLINSLIPFNPRFYDLCSKKPDLYGPFWIYTTLIFVIAASGSLTKYLHHVSNEEFFQEFVPLAASVIYGIGFILPIILTILMKFFGSETTFASVLCIYAYSFTVYIPTVILCIPFESLQWILIGYAVISSTGFLLVNYWKELDKYIANRKYFILGVIFIFQLSLFLILKLQFFAKIKDNYQSRK